MDFVVGDGVDAGAANSLTPYQRALLRRMAGKYVKLLPSALAEHVLLAFFTTLEVLNVPGGQIEAVLGSAVVEHLNEVIDNQVKAERAGAVLQRIAVVGAVDAGGRIHYTEAGRRWLEDHDHEA
jgi:hypothetical protein